jgi:hypothetical protein
MKVEGKGTKWKVNACHLRINDSKVQLPLAQLLRL